MKKSSSLVKSIILGKTEGKRRGGQPGEGKWLNYSGKGAKIGRTEGPGWAQIPLKKVGTDLMTYNHSIISI